MFEINGNLNNAEYGLSNFNIFLHTICAVKEYYVKYIGKNAMDSIDLYVDNATADSGYTPIITPVLGKYLSIKLHINPQDSEGRIAYQFSHELMHFVFYAKYGLGKEMADEREESICTAAALIILYHLYPEHFEAQNEHTKNSKNDGYREGTNLAHKVEYKFKELLKMI